MNDNRFGLLKQIREAGNQFSPLIDEAALGFATESRQRLASTLGVKLTWGQWSQLTAVLQTQFAVAIRHSAFELPPFPSLRDTKAEP